MHEFSHTRLARLSTRSGSFFFLVNSRKGGGLNVQFFEDGLRVRPLHLSTTTASGVSRCFLGWSCHFNLATTARIPAAVAISHVHGHTARLPHESVTHPTRNCSGTDNLVRIPINDAFCVDDLLARGFQAVTVLDVSQVAFEATKKRKGTSHKELVEKIDQYAQTSNHHAQPFVWTATADSIFAKVQRLCERIYGTGH